MPDYVQVGWILVVTPTFYGRCSRRTTDFKARGAEQKPKVLY
jgi:hypothetical protein